MKKQFVLLVALSVICLSSPAQTKSTKQSAKQKLKDTVSATAPKVITFTLTNDQGRNLFQLIHNADSVMSHSHGALSAGDYVEYFGPRWNAYMKLIQDQYVTQTTPPVDTSKNKKK